MQIFYKKCSYYTEHCVRQFCSSFLYIRHTFREPSYIAKYFSFVHFIHASPGITPVQFLTFTPLACIQWTEPVFISDDVKDLMYNISVSGADLLPLTITTNETQYCVESIAHCQEYTFAVNPFSTSLEYIGGNVAITIITPGGAHGLSQVKQG